MADAASHVCFTLTGLCYLNSTLIAKNRQPITCAFDRKIETSVTMRRSHCCVHI